jgi:hypothetical protein
VTGGWLSIGIEVADTLATVRCKISEVFVLLGGGEQFEQSLVVQFVMLSLEKSSAFTLATEDYLVQLTLGLE